MPALTTAAIVGGGALAAGGSIAAGAIGASAAGDAADAQTQATRESIAAQREMAEKAAALFREQAGIARDDLAPFRESQLSALQQLAQYADPNSAYYNQERDVGTQAIQRQLAAQGLLRSKKQSDLLTDLELGMQRNRLSTLQSLAGTGAVQSSAGISQGLGQGLANIYGGLGNQVGSGLQQLGQIAGQSRMAQANAWSGALGGFNNAIQGSVGGLLNLNAQKQQLLYNQQLLKSLTGGGGVGGFTSLGMSPYGSGA